MNKEKIKEVLVNCLAAGREIGFDVALDGDVAKAHAREVAVLNVALAAIEAELPNAERVEKLEALQFLLQNEWSSLRDMLEDNPTKELLRQLIFPEPPQEKEGV